MSIDQARELVSELQLELPDALVTMDPRDADNALDRPGKVAVIVNPPKLTQLTTTTTQADWTITVAAGPADDIVRAWTLLSPAVEQLLLVADMCFTTAEPTAFRSAGGKDFPAYSLTLET